MTLTTACAETWPMMVFWTIVTASGAIAAFVVIGGFSRDYFENRRARQRGEGVE